MKRCVGVAIMLLMAASAAVAGDPAKKAVQADKERAFQAAKRGYWQEAMAQYEQGLEQVPNDAELLNNLAVAHEAIGDFETAKTLYQQALEIAPSDRRIRKNFMLFNEFYMNFVLRPDDDEKADEADDETDGEEAEEAGESTVEEGGSDE